MKKMIEWLKPTVQTASNWSLAMGEDGLTQAMENITYVHEQLQASEYHFGSAVRIDRDFRNHILGEKIQKIKGIVKKSL